MYKFAAISLIILFVASCDTEPEQINYDILVSGSDDYPQYKEAFITATKRLILTGKCDSNDFEYIGGWVKSTNYVDDPIYFMYCGEMSNDGKIYLNTETGEVFRQ
ncbi:MAG: hypothetical protein COA81_12725 [Alphaproteobacteria bacterium]|nr:MAG: hypothetical protein COA81_12725 [Alphaproteobacteria bacterium]